MCKREDVYTDLGDKLNVNYNLKFECVNPYDYHMEQKVSHKDARRNCRASIPISNTKDDNPFSVEWKLLMGPKNVIMHAYVLTHAHTMRVNFFFFFHLSSLLSSPSEVNGVSQALSFILGYVRDMYACVAVCACVRMSVCLCQCLCKFAHLPSFFRYSL